MRNPAIYKFKRTERIQQAVILAAGLGSRLARCEGDIKPLRQVGGKSLVRRNIELLFESGIKEVIIVTGYHAEQLERQIVEECEDLPVRLIFQYNADYRKQNGLSVLAAEPVIRGNFLLMMADHIFAPEMMASAVRLTPPSNGALLCVDYKLGTIFDMDDATKVDIDPVTGEISRIGKQLTGYNAVDTGLFVCSRALFGALEVARDSGESRDCSLSEGIGALIDRGSMLGHDIGDARWQDVDDEMMLAQANRMLSPSANRLRRVSKRLRPHRVVAALLAMFDH